MATTMKAAVLHGAKDIRLENLKTPDLSPGYGATSGAKSRYLRIGFALF